MSDKLPWSIVSGKLVDTGGTTYVRDHPSDQVRPGQVRWVVASLKAPFGPPLSEMDRVEVTLTVDGGPEEAEVKARQGREGLRRGRMLRVLDEVLEQGGVLALED
jgi:hypothetical protein